MRPISRPSCFPGQNDGCRTTSGNGGVAARQHRPLEFVERHRFGEHMSLQQVKAEIAHDEKIRLGFYAFGD
jgi:hypothetical protein